LRCGDWNGSAKFAVAAAAQALHEDGLLNDPAMAGALTASRPSASES
jgi:hypothetical protein